VRTSIPSGPGVGFKPQHFRAITAERQPLAFLEVHAENYMGAGGAPHAQLTRLRADYPLSLHGVGLSIGGARPLDGIHLDRLVALNHRYEPGLFSEHLAWSSHDVGFLNDLLPVPYSGNSLAVVCAHIDEVQTRLGRTMLLENPSTYVLFESSEMSETDFLREIARRTGCGLLLDINNVFVSAKNHATDPFAYIDDFPLALVGEFHLGGHAPDTDEDGAPLLIDAHDRPVIDPVWALFRHALARRGPAPTLVEWDNDVPEWSVLLAEAMRAQACLDNVSGRLAAE
jgi:uncharacterized protein (UPF0276 family)